MGKKFPRAVTVKIHITFFAAALVLSGCAASSVDPIPQKPSRIVQEALDASYERYGRTPSSPWGFAYCYSASSTNLGKLIETAKNTCGRGRLEYRGTDNVFSDCPLFQISRANFVCYPQAGSGETSEELPDLGTYKDDKDWADDFD